ncbi:hypothetical protein ACERZ8_13410 [Tateyamaria armeniaca]|uniref:Uncharacterized protein n=1 Tax=Tateyamaria armeniaca TaxID=2518930 RepID=A0ABW8UY43_9RHOB
MKQAASLLLIFAATVAGAQVDADKKAAFIAVLERNDCRMHNFSPTPDLINDIAASGLERPDVRAIGQDMMAKGEAVADGDFFVLKTGACK